VLFEGVSCHVFAMIDGDTDYFKPIFSMFVLKSLQQGDFTPTGLAPGRPEIDYQELAAEGLERRGGPAEGGQNDRGQIFGDLAGHGGGGSCGGARRGPQGVRIHERTLGACRVVGEEAARRAQCHQARAEQSAGEAARRRGAHEVGLIAARVRAANASAFM
jgi:hypothetical protein